MFARRAKNCFAAESTSSGASVVIVCCIVRSCWRMSLLPSLERWCARERRRFRQLERDVEREPRSLARCRFQPDLASEQVGEPSRQRKAEAGPAVAASRRPIELPELVEHELV